VAKKKVKQEQLFFKQNNDNDDNIFYDKMESLYNLISQKGYYALANYKNGRVYIIQIVFHIRPLEVAIKIAKANDNNFNVLKHKIGVSYAKENFLDEKVFENEQDVMAYLGGIIDEKS
jgi:hypothetical protein